jgi:hypothetical protein
VTAARFFAVFALAALAAPAADAPRITYTKSFPRSSPAYVEISVQKNGAVEYREATDDENPFKFQLTDKECAGIFDLADQLGHFTRPLDANLKVAFTGTKIFRWEQGSEKHEVKFNYSQDPAAQQLWDWFERITESEQRLAILDRAVKFDKLGVNDALLQLEAARDRNRLIGSAQFLPLLDRIVKNESYLHMARERAANLADAIRNPKPVVVH